MPRATKVHILYETIITLPIGEVFTSLCGRITKSGSGILRTQVSDIANLLELNAACSSCVKAYQAVDREWTYGEKE